MTAWLKRKAREHANRAWLAWHVAALGRADKFPTFDKFTGLGVEPQTPEMMMTAFRALAALGIGDFTDPCEQTP